MNELKLKKMKVEFFVSETRTRKGVFMPTLCHGDSVLRVERGDEDGHMGDGVITKNTNMRLGIATADCAPVCFADGRTIGIIHVGWRGLCLGLIEKTLQEFDANTVEVFVGPHLHFFEIQKDFCYDAIEKKFGERFFRYEDAKILFLFKDAITSCLPPSTKFDERNTGEDMSIPSNRRDRTTKRLITVVSFTE